MTFNYKLLDIKVSKQDPFLIKRTFLVENTKEQIDDHCFFKSKEGFLFLYRPITNKEWEVMDEKIISTEEWKNFKEEFESKDFISLLGFKVVKENCVVCAKKNKEVLKNSNQDLDELTEVSKMFPLCHECIKKAISDVKNTKTEKNKKGQKGFLVMLEELENFFLKKEKNE